MIVTDREPTSLGGGRDSQPSDELPARPYPPGSRLRQALDLARKSSGQPSGSAADAALEGATEPKPEPIPPADENRRPDDDSVRAGAEDTPAARHELDTGLENLLPPGDTGEMDDETWKTAAQGWVQTAPGTLEWRPIVTTVDRVDGWEVATYVGIVAGQAAAPPRSGRRRSMGARREAVRRMVADAVARGAHGVLGVSFDTVSDADGSVVTATGTAVTLNNRRRSAF